MTKTCPDCGKTGLSRVGSHISQTDCTYPKLSNSDYEILRGMLMGDGHIRPDGIFEISVTEKGYLKFVQTQLPEWFISNGGVSMVISETSNEGHIWRLRSVCSDEMKDMRQRWYDSGDKVFPVYEIELTPKVLSHWYACDGGLDGRDRPCLYSSNEDTEKLEDWLTREGFDVCSDNSSVRFNKDGKEELFRMIDKPLPGYEYKWPDLDKFSL